MKTIDQFLGHEAERRAQGLPPKPLNAEVTALVCAALETAPTDKMLDLLTNNVSPGVDPAAEVKAAWLHKVAKGEIVCTFTPEWAAKLLGTMLGGYNVVALVDLITNAPKDVAETAAESLAKCIIVYNAFDDVNRLAQDGNIHAQAVLESWARADWFTSREQLPDTMTLTVFKVEGTRNTDNMSPAQAASTRPDIPLHAQEFLKTSDPDALETIAKLRTGKYPVAFVGNTLGTGSSRKSGVNSAFWHMGHDIPYVPAKRTGAVVIGGLIAPIFYGTVEDSGGLPISGVDVSKMETGDIITLDFIAGTITKDGEVLTSINLTPTTLADEFRAGGRLMWIVGRKLTAKACKALGREFPQGIFTEPEMVPDNGKGYTLAQKIVGRACGLPGVRAGQYCEPEVRTVGSQDTTGPMTRDEITELAALGFSADLVLQSFCHTPATPNATDLLMHQTLPGFMTTRHGVSLKVGDGVIHSWLNRLCIPDEVVTGGDSHTRSPLGIAFPAGSGQVAFAAVTGSMPINMPESVLVRFTGTLQPGITTRDLVHAIPWQALKMGLLELARNKGEGETPENVFNGRVLEIEGLEHLEVEQAFELTDMSAERSAAACTIKLGVESVVRYVQSNVALIQKMIDDGYQDKQTLERRKAKLEEWLKNPVLMERDADAEYAQVIEVDMTDITEPLLCCPNDPDDVQTLSEVQGAKIDEVFIGSCMANVGHFRAAGLVLKSVEKLGTVMYVAPPTKMDASVLKTEGYYDIFGKLGVNLEIPGCSICMGNQKRVAEKSTVVSTSTRNFPDRMGKGANVYLSSAELAACVAALGRIPTMDEYMSMTAHVRENEGTIFVYHQFNETGVPTA